MGDWRGEDPSWAVAPKNKSNKKKKSLKRNDNWKCREEVLWCAVMFYISFVLRSAM